MRKEIAIGSLLMCLALPAWADVIATWSLPEGQTMVIKYRDDDNFRVEIDPTTYQLSQKGELYMVTGQGKDVMVMKLADMMRQMRAMGGGNEPDSGPIAKVDLRDTGRKETVAGMKGSVYEMITTEPNGERLTEEMVFSSEPLALELQKAMMAYGSKTISVLQGGGPNPMQNMMGHPKMDKAGGVLRVGRSMTLVSVKRSAIPDAELRLPPNAQVMSMPAMPPMPKGR